MDCLTTGPPSLVTPRDGKSWQPMRARPMSGANRNEGMVRVRASNERWVRNRQQLELEFRRVERESAKQEESDHLLERLGDLVAQMLCPVFGGVGQHENRDENDSNESQA
jgi:hypothetical protein